ncbi:MAG TPA: hypothetical protein VIM30_12255 [Candidatus Limnocylindrales bacterium]|jgi:hypothetical protein
MPDPGLNDLLGQATAILEGAPLSSGPRWLVAIGWATVDAGRAARELAPHLGQMEEGGFTDAPPDLLLGATCLLGRPTDPSAPSIVLLEPSTEGRLAAFLARNGEGVAVVYVTSAEGFFGSQSSTARSRPGEGPFGPERLILGSSRLGPSVALVAPGDPGGGPATIAR